ncbi:hypothetical protein SprV_0902713900 [Sparganum proliferum]
MEIIKKALMQFLEQHHLLSDAQHGFRRGRSCLTNLFFTLDRWTKACDEGNVVHAIYTDFKKALDSVPQKRLLHKLRNAGIRGRLLAWIQSFSAGRSQRVQVGRQQSSEVSVVSGVPQGSVLGPTLFIVFINDCVKDLDCDAILFADDIKLWKVIHHVADADHLQANLNRLEDWSKRWLRPINIGKCNFLQLGSFRAFSPRTYFLHGTPLQQVDNQKDLGVGITSALKPTLYCAKAAKSATATLQLIKRAFMGFDPDRFSKIVGTYVRPHLEYAIQTWRPWTVKDHTILEKVQRNAIEGLFEVGVDGVHHIAFIACFGPAVERKEQIRETGPTSSKAVLGIGEEVVLLEELHQGLLNDLHDFETDGGKTHWPVVIRRRTTSNLKKRSDGSGLPIRGQASSNK